MSVRTLRLVAALLLVLATTILLGSAALAAPPAQDQPLRVVTKPIPPFVMVDAGGDLSGFSIDLWAGIAREIGRKYEWVPVQTVTDQINAITTKRADVAIAAITITQEREQVLDFSYPYFKSGLGILTATNQQTSVLDAIAVAFSPALLRLLAFVIVLLIIVGHIIWLVERNRNPDFPKDYVHGVWAGIWYAGVTVTTVGYGDKTPRSNLGRLVGLIWMFAGLFVIANFTAGVTAQLAIRELRGAINGPQDLAGKAVVTVQGSTSDQWLTQQGIPHATVPTINEAYVRLTSGQDQAIVYDYPVLLFYSINEGRESTRMVGGPFKQEDYGIAVQTDSPLREEINQALLRMIEDGEYQSIYTKWFGANLSQ